MNIERIIKYAGKPELYTPGTAIMWTDKHISKQLLEVHLNEEIDLASRKKSTINTTVKWILNQAKKERLSILDLGCGPGLYTELMAEKGHRVTGVDFSENSIEYAREQAQKKQLVIRYINANYLLLEMDENQFDLVILIYTDFCVLQPKERKQLLSNIRKWLKPGGIFIFDANSDKELDKKVAPKNWEAAEKGFWRELPYLALSESYIYRDEKIILFQHIVSDENGKTEAYRFYTHFFSEENLKNELSENGFAHFSFHTDILPQGDLWNGEYIFFCVAANRK